MFGMPSMMGYAMPSSSLMSSFVASSYLSGRLESGHTRKRSSDGSRGCGRAEPEPEPELGPDPEVCSRWRWQCRPCAGPGPGRAGRRSSSGSRAGPRSMAAASAPPRAAPARGSEGTEEQGCPKAGWLSVTFLGEMGVDEGAVSQELFSVAARTLCQPSTSAFCHFASGLVWFPRQAPSCKDEDTFLLIGTLCGMALFNLRMVPFPFPRALYKKLLDLAPTLEDLEDLLPTMGRSLQKILNDESDSLDLDFTIMEGGESTDVVELKENGANIPVTKDNRKEYVDLYVNYIFNKSVKKPFEDFMQGFLRGCPARNWKMFFPEELQVLLQGRTIFDWHLLEKNVTYRQYTKLDQTIRNFWTVFHKLPEEKKKMLLAFLSGSDRLSGYGLECFRFCIEDPQVENPDESLPYASICYLTLFLPRYSNKKILKKKLLYAIEHNEGFGRA